MGGTGSYILDFVSKTPVKEIHLYDGDLFLSHNAFRSPGAASINQLKKHRKKTEYLKIVYSKMHKKIIAHSFFINDSNIDKLSNFDFVFICIDDGELKELLFNSLIKHNIPFIDVGIGVNPVDDMLIGDIRTTIVTPDKNSHVKKRVSFNNTEYDAYSTNIQIAELNALNASFAVIKWKKYFGFYQDLEKEYNSTFSLNVNTVFNDDNKS